MAKTSRAKPIRFHHQGQQLVFQINKVDRSKLYGFKEQKVHDENEQICELATLAEDGKTLIGKGGTGIGQLTADGKWTDKTKLKPVDLEGNEIEPVPSSFAAPINLGDEATLDDYLNHNIRLIYQLVIAEGSQTEEKLVKALREGAIFKFPYSYRGGLEADVGFILMNESNDLFFLVGSPAVAEFIGLQQVIVPPGEDSSDDDQLMDFSMM